ncbi:MAG: Fe(2+) transporter permease subunit FeoB [Rhodospirillales bacterium]|jgi:ferrous iron transport protein B
MPSIVIGVVGNPNCGKTTLFNALTGSRQHVGNWPGVTVEKKTGSFKLGQDKCTVVDLPGVYSLGGSANSSEDERVARDYVLSGEAGLIVNIVDASNLERNLYLTTQLLEMRVPLVIAVNMMDIAKDRGIAIDLTAMSARLGCPVVPIVATRKKGLEELKNAIHGVAVLPTPPKVIPTFDGTVELALEQLSRSVAAILSLKHGDPRWLATKLLEGDEAAKSLFKGCLDVDLSAKMAAIETALGEEADIIIADGRFAFVTKVIAASVRRTREASRTLSDRIDRLVLDRVLGIPIFILMMYLMFMFTINVGGAFIDFFDQAFAALFVEGFGELLTGLGAPDWLKVLLANGAGGGVQTVATFVPVIGALFLFLSLLEDSGYMARAAFVMDRAMRAIGLPGKSFVPLIVGFGCNVPAIMATRTLEHKRDRILTIMMAPFMSCGARLPVYALLVVAFFPEGGQNIVFLLYLIGLAFAIGTGLLLKNTMLQGEASPFVMELPPYHMPTFGTVVRRAWERLAGFIFRAGRVVVPMVVILSFFNAIGADGSFGNEDSDKSVLAEGGRKLIPVFEPMGMTEQNWPAAVGIFTGIFAKEAVVGTLNALYSQVGAADVATAQEGSMEPTEGEAAPAPEEGPAQAEGAVMNEAASEPASEEEAPKTLSDKLLAALMTIPENLAGVADTLADPLGLDISYAADRASAAEELEVEDAAFSAIATRFASAGAAFAYLILILLYMPCVAATGAIYQEVGWRWTLFSAAWTTGLGYCSAVIVYQASVFAKDPMAAGTSIGLALAVILLAVIVMRLLGNWQVRRLAPVAAE